MALHKKQGTSANAQATLSRASGYSYVEYWGRRCFSTITIYPSCQFGTSYRHVQRVIKQLSTRVYWKEALKPIIILRETNKLAFVSIKKRLTLILDGLIFQPLCYSYKQTPKKIRGNQMDAQTKIIRASPYDWYEWYHLRGKSNLACCRWAKQPASDEHYLRRKMIQFLRNSQDLLLPKNGASWGVGLAAWVGISKRIIAVLIPNQKTLKVIRSTYSR